jgi:hypothetical protein
MPTLAVLPAETSVWWVTGAKQTNFEDDPSPLFCVKVNEWSYNSTPPMRLHDMIRNKFMFTSTIEKVA